MNQQPQVEFQFTQKQGTNQVRIVTEFKIGDNDLVKQIVKLNEGKFDWSQRSWYIPQENLNNLQNRVKNQDKQLAQLLPNAIIGQQLLIEQPQIEFKFQLSTAFEGRVIIKADYHVITEGSVKQLIKVKIILRLGSLWQLYRANKILVCANQFLHKFCLTGTQLAQIKLRGIHPNLRSTESIDLANELEKYTTNQIDGIIKSYSIKSDLNEKLYQYQRDCIAQGIKFKGKILIADEMGLGKTVQSLALASVYHHSWPLLIICPSHLKLQWKTQIENWLKLPSGQIQIIMRTRDQIKQVQVTIISYKLCLNLTQQLTEKQYKICIVDESQFLKNYKSQTTNACKSILESCFQLIFLSGTPMMSRPAELFPQLNIINRYQYASFFQFGQRYCNPQPNLFTSGGYDYLGASNTDELYEKLTQTIMIRRMKSEVEDQLPELRRYKILLDLGLNGTHNQSNAIAAYNNGPTKLEQIKQFLEIIFDSEIKFLFFAFHLNLLDAVEKFCEERRIKSIRIDGLTDAQNKNQNVQIFQQNPDVKIAILSLKAASTGINLTAANLIVFGELYWTPAVMIQAESRAHRIGQEKNVECYYLVGKGTYDEEIYTMIESKYNTLSNCLNGMNEDFGAQVVEDELINLEQQQVQNSDFDSLSDNQDQGNRIQGIQQRIRRQNRRGQNNRRRQNNIE